MKKRFVLFLVTLIPLLTGCNTTTQPISKQYDEPVKEKSTISCSTKNITEINYVDKYNSFNNFSVTIKKSKLCQGRNQ